MIILILSALISFSFDKPQVDTWLQGADHLKKEKIHQYLCGLNDSKEAFYYAISLENEGGIHLGKSNLSTVLNDFAKSKDKKAFCSDEQLLVYMMDLKSNVNDSYASNASLFKTQISEKIQPVFVNSKGEK